VAAPAPEGDAEPASNVPVDIEEPATDAAALEAIPEAPAPEPLEPASDPAPVEAAQVLVLVSVSEGPTIALEEQTEQIGEVTLAPDSLAPVQAPEAALKTDVKTDLAPTEFIEVWRPGRRDDHARKPRHESAPRQRRPQRQRHTPPPAAASDGIPVVAVAEGTPPPAAGDAGAGTAPDHRRDGGRHRARPADAERPERQPRPDQRPDRRVRAERPGGPEHERGQRGGGRPPPRGDRPDRDPTLRAKYIKGRGEGRDRRDREPDPNSPFAKLAALKEQLEANAKEPR
jgi:ATP-dependent RNA helicase SUPV3L1/SUV3